MNREELLKDLTPFCDIGQPAPRIAEEAGKLTAKMIRDGNPLKIVIDTSTGKTQTTRGTASAKSHASVAAMFASPLFADLRRWADAQAELLKRDATPEKHIIPINGITHDAKRVRVFDDVDDILDKSPQRDDVTHILLIDGPAGIGKTNLIEQLALRHADGFKTSPRPLILHVKSRGRILSNLQDLLAFSLQTVRTSITYDQVPILAKYGLVVIAIDGFDELGDPNGYELAWAQVRDLVTSVRGKGKLILSGRDTFIGRQRLLRDVTSLREGIDDVSSLTLESPTPDQARDWLKNHGWTDADFALPSVSVLLEERSFALRPVFLKLLRENITPRELEGKDERYLTPLLVHHIVGREAKLFGSAVETVLSLDGIQKFLMNYMYEISREMADSQTEALDTTTLMWIAEAALGDGFAKEVVALIKNRACVVAFLANDERPGYRKFIHTHLQNYFLAGVTIDTISCGDIPKFIRRNILGSEYLAVFADVVTDEATSNPEKIKQFTDRTINFPHSYQYVDRAIRNVGALIFASLPNLDTNSVPTIANFQIDDAVTIGTATRATLHEVSINQLDCRGADLRPLTFSESSIVTVIANQASMFSPTFPIPKLILLESSQQLTDSAEIEGWLANHGRNTDESVLVGISSSTLKQHPVYRLLGQACRIRQYWLRAEDDLYGKKILKNEYWAILSDTLRKHGFLREETRQASGRASVFVHIKHKDRILAEDTGDDELAKFFLALEIAVTM